MSVGGFASTVSVLIALLQLVLEVCQWGLKVSWQRLVPLCWRLAFAAPVGALGLCALVLGHSAPSWCIFSTTRQASRFPLPRLYSSCSVSCPCFMRPVAPTTKPFPPARVHARQRVHGSWARRRGRPRRCAPLSGQAPDRRSAKLPVLCRGHQLQAVREAEIFPLRPLSFSPVAKAPGVW